MRARIVALLFVVVAALSAGSRRAEADRAPRATGHVVIASKNFTESRLLGEMLTLLVRSRTHLTVEHRSGLGATLLCFGALRAGQIDVYPDYTGTAWSVVLKKKQKITGRLQAFLEVQKEYRELYDVEWLEPFGLNNTYALAMREDRAQALGVRTISDLRPHAKDLEAGFSIEFSSREDGWPGLAPYYGLELRQVRTLEHGLAYEAVAKGSIDLVDAYSTDGKLLRYPLRVLVDDRHFFPPYDAAPVVRGATLRAHPELRDALDALAFRISNQTMMHLNDEVEEQGRGFREVARDFLVQQKLLDARLDVGSDALAGRRSFASFLAERWKETLRLGLQHVELTLAAVLLAILVAVPLGIVVSRSRAAERLALGGAGVVQTIPSLALLAFMIAVPGLGLSVRSAVAALFLYAILPILRNTHAGLNAVDPELVDAATGLGLTPRQVLVRIRLPLATRTIMAGVRTATIISIGVATLAAFIGAGGLGEPIVTGLYLNDTWLVLSGAIPAALLALAADYLLGRVELWLTPRGI